ncbi:MAG: LptF/LptG family permease [Planctomycetota bacterium]
MQMRSPFFAIPRLLWRVLLGDVLRTLVLTAASLIILIAFAASVKPLADGKIDLGDMLLLMALLAIPMMQFALPFAAGFASALGYHRFAADNEAQAAMSAGVSHRSLLVPAGIVGLMVAGAIYALLTMMVPEFLRSAEQLIRRDITRAIIAPINRGQTITIDGSGLDIWAERSIELPPPEKAAKPGDPLPKQHIRLEEVVVAQSADRLGSGEMPWFVSTDVINLYIFDVPGEASTMIQLTYGKTGAELPEGQLNQEDGTTKRIIIPGSFRDDPKFKTARALRRAMVEPRDIGPIDRSARRLSFAVLQERAASVLDASLRDSGLVVLERVGEQRYTLYAGGIEHVGAKNGEATWQILPSTEYGDIRLVHDRDDGEVIHVAQSATLVLASGADHDRRLRDEDARAEFVIHLEEVRNTTPSVAAGVSAGEQAEFMKLSRGQLLLDERYGVSGALDQPVGVVIDEARASGIGRLVESADRLEGDVFDLRREIVSKQHERIATAAGSFFMVLLAAGIALRRSDLMPVPVYLLSFFPALGVVILISAGQGLAHQHGMPGLVMIWGAVAGIAILTVYEYSKLAKH